jgi:hypothetical protein
MEMPLAVEININGVSISEIYIGRLEGGTSPDDENTYKVLYNPTRGMSNAHYGIPRGDWHNGVSFTHRYGDGAEICAMKAIAALQEAGALK